MFMWQFWFYLTQDYFTDDVGFQKLIMNSELFDGSDIKIRANSYVFKLPLLS